MFNGFWTEFSILFLAAIFGSIAILPYSLRLLKESGKKKPLKIPLWVVLLLSVFQNAVIFALAIGIGLLAAHAIGLGAPFVEALIFGNDIFQRIPMLMIPLLLGLFSGAALLLMDLRFLPYFPEKLLTTAKKTTQWENFTSSFYGGINEEIVMRLFGLSSVAWLLARIWHTPNGLPTTTDFIVANIVMAIIFALGHLPAIKSVTGTISQAMLLRTLVLNITIGLICGWVFWTYGIEAAMVTHFVADIVYHGGGTYVLRLKK